MKIDMKAYDVRIIVYYIGYIILGTAAAMVLPMATSLFYREWNILLDFIISCCISIDIGIVFVLLGKGAANKVRVQWKHGLAIASLSWIILMFLCAIPYVLAGNYLSFLDACFDVISGFTTSGLILIQDLDHVSMGINMWRHLITYIGGQGMVVVALSFLVKDSAGGYKMYVGEGKDIELVPNVKGTAKIIWIISIIYLVIGTLALWIDGIIIGLNPVSSFFHGLFIYMSSWSTGGFAPMSQNIMYYHSLSYEIITLLFFIIGSFNFGLHYTIWQGNRKEIFKNIETQSFFITAIVGSFLAAIFLSKTHIYNNAISIFRRVIYNVLSAHTTTGFENVYARQFASDWGSFGIFIMVIVMLIGGSACSTAGGFKGLRIGVVFKGFICDVRKLLRSESRVSIFKYHHIKDHILDDRIVKSSSLIIICYILLFAIGTGIGTFYGYPLADAAFEAASVSGNVGLTIGVTSPSMPSVLKIYYIFAMYLGRLEFISVFALIGFALGGIKRKWLEFTK